MNDYEKIKTKLDEHFLLKRNKHHARYKFLSMKPNASETTLAYAARLREKANECEFGENCNEQTLEHIIQTIENRTLIQKAINKKWNLDRFLEEAGQMEDTRLMVKDMRESVNPEIAKVTKQTPKQTNNQPRNTEKTWKSKHCDRCGHERDYQKAHNCPAYDRICAKCQKRGHYAAVCSSKPTDRGYQGNRYTLKRSDNKRKHVKKAEKEPDSSTSSDDEFFKQTTAHLPAICLN
jgi:hypothetical protein